MTLEEVNKELKELTKNDINKANLIYKLKNLRTKLIHEKCKSDIGRCFKTQNNQYYVKVVDAPMIIKLLTRTDEINEYQYPALYIDIENNIKPFKCEDLFSGVWGKGNIIENNYVEISKEEFNNVFKQMCVKWQATIMEI